jgi:DNA-binding GntR family transcriptional regulator
VEAKADYDASDRPIEHSASWVPLDLAARLPRLRDLAAINEGTHTYVQKATGRTITSTHEDIYAREADDLTPPTASPLRADPSS